MATRRPTTAYTAQIVAHVTAASATSLVDPSSIYALFPSVTEQTVRNKIKEAMALHPAIRGRIADIYPDTKTILDETERLLGAPVVGATLLQANQIAKSLVEGWMTAFTQHFCEKSLGTAYNRTTGQVSLSFADLNTRLLAPYKKYLVQSDNGIVSIAGTLNQSLIVRALRNSGMADTGPNRAFSETGTKAEGDIQIYHSPGGRAANRILYVEAKSYAARERLLRGLADVNTPKVGVGFFNDPTEFNADRVTLMATSAQAQAIYMPQATYNGLTAAAQAVPYAGSGRVCRVLETEFVPDMQHFHASGQITVR